MQKWIPEDMEWFLAELIQQFAYANEDKRDVWVNTILVKASNPEEAYEKALKFGEAYNEKYINSDEVEVTVTFRGLRNLYLVYDKLEDGAEIIYEELEEISENEIAAMVTPKEQLIAIQAHGSAQTELTLVTREGESQ